MWVGNFGLIFDGNFSDIDEVKSPTRIFDCPKSLKKFSKIDNYSLGFIFLYNLSESSMKNLTSPFLLKGFRVLGKSLSFCL